MNEGVSEASEGPVAASKVSSLPPPPPPPPPPGPLSAHRPVDRPARFKILKPLQSRDFTLLWTGLSVSLLGDGLYLVALPLQVLQLSNIETALTTVGLAWTAPQVLFLLFGGVLSDRYERRRVLIAADVIRLAAIATVGILSLAGTLELWHMYLLVAVYGVGEALFGPAFGAIVPDVVPNELLVQANSLDNFSRPFALRVAGPLLGALTIGTIGLGGAFLVDAGTFLVSAIALLLMQSRGGADRSVRRSAARELGEGLRFVRTQPWLWGTLAAVAVGLLAFYGPFQALVPFLVKQNGGDATDFGLILGAAGIGAIVASLLIGQHKLPTHRITGMYVAWSLGTLAVVGFGLFTETWQQMVVSFFMSALFTAGIIIWNTLMHTLVPRKLLGRVSSVDWFVSTSLIPLSFAVTGPISERIGPEATLIAAGLAGGSLVFAFLFIPGVRDPEKGRHSAARVSVGSDGGR
jgi:MFS family permease